MQTTNELDGQESEAAASIVIKRSRRLWVTGTLMVLVAALFFFEHIFFRPIFLDIHGHLDSIQRYSRGKAGLPGNFLYYGLVYVLAGLQGGRIPLSVAGTAVLGTATALRFALDFRILGSRAGDAPGTRPMGPWWILISALALTLAFSLPTPSGLAKGWWYLGQTTPNVWHNSTTIFLMPFAVSLFWVSYRNLCEPSRGRDAGIALLCVLNIIAKPSFFLVFAPTYSLILLVRHGLRREFWARIWPVAIGTAALAAQYYIIFALQYGSRQKQDSHVTLAPLDVWSEFSDNIPLSIVASVFFPLLYIVLYRGALRRQPLMLYALGLYGVAIAMMALLAETGPRHLHANFFWQSFVCSHLLFLATAKQFLERVRDAGWGVREVVLAVGLALHAAAGIAYITRMVVTPDFL